MERTGKSVDPSALLSRLEKERLERQRQMLSGADYIMPDGCEPLPTGIYKRLTDENISATLADIERAFPDGVEAITAPLTDDERTVLHDLGGVGLVTSVESLLD